MENHVETTNQDRGVISSTAALVVWLVKVAIVASPFVGAIYCIGGFARLGMLS